MEIPIEEAPLIEESLPELTELTQPPIYYMSYNDRSGQRNTFITTGV